ncbi:MAG: BamA/TamA family outer membrane protein [Deltaproteobacteria bacterium]|nr:BamA/TamA family outer membrane protein [Deltaproteobacteria bacterium]
MSKRLIIVARSVAVLLLGSAISCAASIPRGRYGISSVELQGVKKFEQEALLSCLATHRRPRFTLNLGRDSTPECDVPPFDPNYLPVDLWIWPWTEWPLYDGTTLERDLDRIERWYQARGYYDALVVDYKLVKNDEDQEIDVEIVIEEGEPITVERIELKGLDKLSLEVREEAQKVIRLEIGKRFDESDYDASKEALVYYLGDASYAKARVDGQVTIDPKRKKAAVVYEITTGPRCYFDKVLVEGNIDLEAEPIIKATMIDPGSPYSESKLKESREAIYDLGAFASVEISPRTREDSNRVDTVVRVVPAKKFRFAVGAGIQVGSDTPQKSVEQWNLHLLLRAEHRDFIGGMRRLRIEDQPRMIFMEAFPQIEKKPHPGNLLTIDFKQPSFFEPRTVLTTAGEWDYGPDPYQGNYVRHDLDIWAGPGRYFFRHALYLSSTIHVNLFLPNRPKSMGTTDGDDSRATSRAAEWCPNWLQDYYVTFIQHSIQVDLRDDMRRPRSGSFYALTIQHAGYFLPSYWDYLRVTPEARGYLPLPLRMVLAGRVRMGILLISDSQIGDDPELQELRDYGPIRYRLRGGGSNSVRGYNPNTLGDTVWECGRLYSGGLRQWEASLELRVPLTVDLGTVVFVDVGDVTIEEVFRFYYPHTTVGFGFRYDTIVGPLRFDFGFLPKGLQTFGEFDPPKSNLPPGKIFGLDGAFHITIGEAF